MWQELRPALPFVAQLAFLLLALAAAAYLNLSGLQCCVLCLGLVSGLWLLDNPLEKKYTEVTECDAAGPDHPIP